MVLPFFISYERTDKEVHEIVEKTFSLLESLANVSIPRKHMGDSWTQGDFGSIEWYVKQAHHKRRRQANMQILWKLFESEPWQEERHHELVVLESDLYMGSEDNNFVFGETRIKMLPDGRIFSDTHTDGKPYVTGIVQSLNRIRKWCGNSWRDNFFISLLHELGHFFGVPSRLNPNYITQNIAINYLDEGHCDDRGCIMEQINIEGRMDLLEKTKFLLEHNPALFCRYDLDTLRKNLKTLYKQT